MREAEDFGATLAGELLPVGEDGVLLPGESLIGEKDLLVDGDDTFFTGDEGSFEGLLDEVLVTTVAVVLPVPSPFCSSFILRNSWTSARETMPLRIASSESISSPVSGSVMRITVD